jgi:hypothetical protein
MIPDIYKNSSQFWESLGLTDTTNLWDVSFIDVTRYDIPQ